MLEGKFDEASLLKKIVDAIKDSVQLCNFNCTEEGIAVQAVDDSRVLLVSLLIGADAFTEYRCDRSITLGVDLNPFSKIIKCGDNDDFLTLIAEDNPDSIRCVFEDKKKDRISEYSLKLMDIDSDFLKIDDMDYSATITMPSVDFARICRDLKTISESLNVSVTKETVKFSTEGELGTGNVVIKPFTDLDNADNSVRIQLSEPVNLSFGLKYLNDIIKATNLSSTVTIKLINQAPALFEYKIPGGHLRFFLAPKIGDDD